MMDFVFLLEERSMIPVLESLLPKILPEGTDFKLIPHEGKSDLEKSIPRKLRGWNTPNTKFVVLRDQDSADCVNVKNKLLELCRNGGKPDTLVRVVCHELESWFLGDLLAVEKGFGINGVVRHQNSRKFRTPDLLENAAEELAKLIPSYQKISGAKAIAPYLAIDTNRSTSFHAFVSGMRRFVA